jgi:GNAT superfamily N-acetyltransferase
MPVDIVVASTARDFAAFGDLVREYWGWLHARYADIDGFVDDVGGHQAVDDELNQLEQRYGAPAGRALLAVCDGEVVGAVAYRHRDDGSCEMKRLFVPDRFQGKGAGRLLCQALVATATVDGYRLMRLDTGVRNTEAIRMYQELGFRECPPYHQYPAGLMPYLRFMERPLGDAPAE